MVRSLCARYSSPLLSMPPPPLIADALPTPPADKNETEQEEETYYPFPFPSVLANPSVSAALRLLGFGYRAGYIQKTARMLVDAHPTSVSSSDVEAPELWLKTLRKASTEEARIELLKLMGVGRKVADCILLMSLDKVC
jgi:N-glycosylase/DNA lyase